MKTSSKYENTAIIEHGPSIKYFAYYTIIEDLFGKSIEFQLSKIAPYVEADFVWAKKGLGANVDFIQDGKVIDKMTLWSFEPDEYESFDEYVNGVFDEVALELEEHNKDVKQTVIHW